mmetsp:Transcript_57980/g.149221  ORF Transcript_57980/g.149221 Transcript_57980/m.149221 type:complete len:497 (+) Transcript_57980:117-1607(+)
MSPAPMDYFAVGGRPFLLQFPACIGRLVTPGRTGELLAEAEASRTSWAELERRGVKGDASHTDSVDAGAGGASPEEGAAALRSMATLRQNPSCSRRRRPMFRTPSPASCSSSSSSSRCRKPQRGEHTSRPTGPRQQPIPVATCARPAVRQGNKNVARMTEATKAPDALHSAFDTSEIKPMDPNRFELLGKVEDAVRNRGKVLLMRDKNADKLVAVKRMPNEWVRGSHSDFVEAYPSETELPWQDIGCNRFLNDVGYQYSCNLLGVFRDETHTDVVTDLASEGDLFRWCEVRLHLPSGPEREALVRPLARQMVEGVQQLHDLSIVHRDLSLENILMSKSATDGSYHVQVIDFGMASTLRYFQRCVRGKASYQAPEVHLDQEYDAFLSDAFSIGVALYAILVKDYPWLSTRAGGCKCYEHIRKHGFRAYLHKRKIRGSTEPVSNNLSESAIRLLEGLLALTPDKRLTLGERTWIKDGTQTRRSVWDEDWLHEGLAGET